MHAHLVRPRGRLNARPTLRFLLICGLVWATSLPLYAWQSATPPENPAADAASSAIAGSKSGGDTVGASVAAAGSDAAGSDAAGESSSAGEFSSASTVAAVESSSAADSDPQDGASPAQSSSTPIGSAYVYPNPVLVDQHFAHDFLSIFLRDQEHIWLGPFEPHNYDSHTMLRFGLPFIVISGVLIGTDSTTAKWLPGPRSGLDRFGTVYSDVFSPYSVAGYAGIWYVVGRATHNEHAREAGFLSLEAIADSQVIAGVLKVATFRARPSGPDTKGAGFWRGGFSPASGGLSMPSGHTIAAFAMATVIAREYRYHLAVPIVAYSLASLVGFARLSAHEHWYSDVFVGSSLGFLTGRYVYINHHDTDLPGSLPARHSPLRPSLEAGPQGLGFYWHF